MLFYIEDSASVLIRPLLHSSNSEDFEEVELGSGSEVEVSNKQISHRKVHEFVSWNDRVSYMRLNQ